MRHDEKVFRVMNGDARPPKFEQSCKDGLIGICSAGRLCAGGRVVL